MPLQLIFGANEGFFSEQLLGLSRSVVAFEPLPQMLSRLRARYTNRMEIVGVVLLRPFR